MGYNPFDWEEQAKNEEEREKAASLAAAETAGDFRWLMSGRKGRRIAYRLLEASGVFRSSFSTDPLRMAFNEGTRNYGLIVLRMIQTSCPEMYPTMIKEQNDDERNNAD